MSAGLPRYFLDTNFLLYAVDARAPEKAARAKQWLAWLRTQAEIQVSWQVLHEFYVNAQRKLGLPSSYARRLVLHYQKLGPVDTDPALVVRAWHWQDEAQLSYWDALILAAAERTESRVLLSEDFSDGRRFADLAVVNPFRHEPGAPAHS